jgi:endonuclease I
MKKTILLCAIGAIAAISIGASGFVLAGNQEKEAQAAVGNYSTSASTYYNGITATSGEPLLGQLHDLITTTHSTYTSYSDCSNPTYVYATDGNPNDANYDYEFYSQANIASTWGAGAQGTWNREHVWCQSLASGLWGKSGGGSDMHHIRPVESGLNTARNNSPFGIVTPHNSSTAKYYEDTNNNNVAIGGYKTGDVFEPLDFVKGDVARIIMYLYTHYNTYSNVGGTTNGSGSSSFFGTLNITNIVYTSAGTADAAWDQLIDWHEADPVDAKETRRNEACAKYQGNRNPFIDNATYANAIWGRWNS